MMSLSEPTQTVSRRPDEMSRHLSGTAHYEQPGGMTEGSTVDNSDNSGDNSNKLIFSHAGSPPQCLGISDSRDFDVVNSAMTCSSSRESSEQNTLQEAHQNGQSSLPTNDLNSRPRSPNYALEKHYESLMRLEQERGPPGNPLVGYYLSLMLFERQVRRRWVMFTQEQNGSAPVPVKDTSRWFTLEYQDGGVDIERAVCCSVETVAISKLSESHKNKNCIHERHVLSGNKTHVYEAFRNQLAWAFADLNPTVLGCKDLLRKIVAYYLSTLDSDSRRRLRRVFASASREQVKDSAPASPSTPWGSPTSRCLSSPSSPRGEEVSECPWIPGDDLPAFGSPGCDVLPSNKASSLDTETRSPMRIDNDENSGNTGEQGFAKVDADFDFDYCDNLSENEAPELATSGDDCGGIDLEPCYVVLHRVNCHKSDGSFLCEEVPTPNEDGPTKGHLNEPAPIRDFDGWVEKRPHLDFVAIRDYACPGCDLDRPSTRHEGHAERDSVQPLSARTKAVFYEADRQQYREVPMDSHRVQQRTNDARANVEADEYAETFIYRNRHFFQEVIGEQPERQDVEELLHCFIRHDALFAEEFEMCDHLFARGLVEPRIVKYLFSAHEVVVCAATPTLPGLLHCFVVSTPPDVSEDNGEIGLCGWNWNFDGTRLRRRPLSRVHFKLPLHEPVPITSLPVYPFRYAPQNVKTLLRQRGNTFWKNRLLSHVTYDGWDVDKRRDSVRFPSFYLFFFPLSLFFPPLILSFDRPHHFVVTGFVCGTL
jgi:hypothetical protein